MPTGSINNGVSANLPVSTSNYVSPFLVTFSCSSFFVIAVLLYVRPYLEAGEPLPFGQLQLEVHVWDKKFTDFMKWWELLEEAGLRPFWTEVRASKVLVLH